MPLLKFLCLSGAESRTERTFHLRIRRPSASIIGHHKAHASVLTATFYQQHLSDLRLNEKTLGTLVDIDDHTEFLRDLGGCSHVIVRLKNTVESSNCGGISLGSGFRSFETFASPF